jgi:hypothetical protein
MFKGTGKLKPFVPSTP